MAYFDRNYFRLFLYYIKVFRYTVDKEVIEVKRHLGHHHDY
jgi:hypothetical protein